jgi:hypothetical protein
MMDNEHQINNSIKTAIGSDSLKTEQNRSAVTEYISFSRLRVSTIQGGAEMMFHLKNKE